MARPNITYYPYVFYYNGLRDIVLHKGVLRREKVNLLIYSQYAVQLNVSALITGGYYAIFC